MKYQRNRHPQAGFYLLIAGMATFCGCEGGENTSPATTVDYEHQHGHEVPAHRPRDIAHAAEVIDALCERVSAREEDRSVAQDQLADVIRWLPELAAQTDLTEAEWTEIYDYSQRLTQACFGTADTSTSEQALEALKQLTSRLRTMTSDGRWQSLGAPLSADSVAGNSEPPEDSEQDLN